MQKSFKGRNIMKTIKEPVLSAKNGNKKAFDMLYELTSNDVWFTCISLLKDEKTQKIQCRKPTLPHF